MFLNFDRLAFRYDPYPIGVAKPVMDDGFYEECCANYPDIELFEYIPKIGKKYSLSERFNGKQYDHFIRANPLWREFHRWIKSTSFIEYVMRTLNERHIDLGYDRPKSAAKGILKRTRNLLRGRFERSCGSLSARFEFSMLPADGGSVTPHTDAPQKIVTLIVSMIADDEWDPAFGGGTEISRPKDPSLIYNQMNRQLDFDELLEVDTFPFTANQAIVFIKTFNSWHAVRPMTGSGSRAMRKTLTINIESR